MKYRCKKCNHVWLTRLENRKPVECPRCKRTDWDKKIVSGANFIKSKEGDNGVKDN